LKRKQLAANVAISAATIVLMVALLEGGIRLLFPDHPQPDRFRLSSLLGWEWTPGYREVEQFNGVDYQMVISQQGLRNEPIAVPKPAGTYRIIALGDSITEGPGVELAGTLVKILERSLAGETAGANVERVEVINAGTGDYGTEQELIWLRERGLGYEPDLVLINLYLNDSRSFSPPSSFTAAYNNYLATHSAFFTFWRSLVRQRLVAQNQAADDFRFRYLPAWEAGGWRTDTQALTELIQAADQDWGLAWYDEELLRLEALLGQFLALAEERGFALRLAIFPVNVQVYAEVDTPLDLTGPQYELVHFAQQQGLPVVDLLPALRANRDEALYYDQAHLTARGHEVAAEVIRLALEGKWP
jgi:lysophospholipase L1-like esterase